MLCFDNNDKALICHATFAHHLCVKRPTCALSTTHSQLNGLLAWPSQALDRGVADLHAGSTDDDGAAGAAAVVPAGDGAERGAGGLGAIARLARVLLALLVVQVLSQELLLLQARVHMSGKAKYFTCLSRFSFKHTCALLCKLDCETQLCSLICLFPAALVESARSSRVPAQGLLRC